MPVDPQAPTQLGQMQSQSSSSDSIYTGLHVKINPDLKSNRENFLGMGTSNRYKHIEGKAYPVLAIIWSPQKQVHMFMIADENGQFNFIDYHLTLLAEPPNAFAEKAHTIAHTIEVGVGKEPQNKK